MGTTAQELQLPRRRPVTYDQLVTISDLEKFKSDLLLSIKNLLSENKAQPDKKWLKSYEVKKLLKISTSTLQNLRSNGTLPFTKIGGIIYYDRADIEKLLENLKRNFGKKF
jgi:hypothetical protein